MIYSWTKYQNWSKSHSSHFSNLAIWTFLFIVMVAEVAIVGATGAAKVVGGFWNSSLIVSY